MLRQAGIYLAVLRTQLKTVAHFRANVIAWIFFGPLQIGIMLLLWSIIYRQTDSVGGFAFKDMVLYYLVVYYLRRIIEPIQTVAHEVWTEINQGQLDIYLARPVSYGLFVLFRSLATPLVELIIGAPFFILICWLLKVAIPTNPLVWLAFIASVASGYLILFLVQFLIGTMTFWMERIFGLRDLIFSIFMLFSGQLIPISVLPDVISKISQYLPFQAIYYIPALIFAESESEALASSYLLQQVIWISVLGVLAVLMWSRGVRRYVSQGG